MISIFRLVSPGSIAEVLRRAIGFDT